MNGLTTVESKRRAVAPIIATLLMVAIAVVGGILIFVFTQGFFADEQVVGPTVDNIRIFGYDASNTVDVQNNTGGTLDCDADGDTDGNDLRADDCVAIYVTNLGDKPAAIQAVRIFGETMTVSSVTGTSDCPTTQGEFNILEGTTVVSIIDPNTDVSICVQYDGSAGNVKQGRTIPIQVETSNGQSSQINIINGAKRGQN